MTYRMFSDTLGNYGYLLQNLKLLKCTAFLSLLVKKSEILLKGCIFGLKFPS